MITVSMGRDVNGKKISRYLTWVPDKDYTPKQLDKELQRQATLFEEACRTGQVTKGGNMKLVDFIPKWLENIKASIAVTTYKKYEYLCRTLIIPALGHMKLKDIKPIHVQQYVNALTNTKLDNKNGEGKDGKTLAASTVQRYYTCLRSIMHDAYRLELIPSNPCDSGKIKLPQIGETVTEIYDKEELAELLEALEGEPLQFQVLIHLAIITGCRRGELVALEWSDIDFDKGSIFIHKSAYKIKGEPIGIKDTKSHRSRTVIVPEYVLEMLRDLHSEQLQRQLKLGTAWQGKEWLFTKANGDIMFPTSPTMIFSKFLKRKGLPHKKFHALRHTSATLSLIYGIDIKTVGERLGHSQMKTTNRYLHAIEEADRRAADVLGGIVLTLQAENRKKHQEAS